MIRLTNLKFKVEENHKTRNILDIPSYDFEDSKVNVVMGPSGSGKTTLLYALAGILDISEGKVEIDGTSLYDLDVAKRDAFRMSHISMIYQKYNLFNFMNVEENILMPYLVRGEKIDASMKMRVAAYLEMMQLKNVQNKQICELSGGEQQRVAIIRAMIVKPRILLCDEPTASLDSENTIRFMENLCMLNKEKKTTIIIATHDEKVEHYQEGKIEMLDGKII